MVATNNLHIGTCSWKYDSWRGLIYPDDGGVNYLQEYAKTFTTVEIDQWFWSLFANDKVVLPKKQVVEEYNAVVGSEFSFAIKVPNAITLTHHYNKKKNEPMLINPHFLSVDIMNRFLESIKPFGNKLGPLMFQFEYLNKKKMAGLSQFLDKIAVFFELLPKEFSYFIELRNPNYLKKEYFEFIKEQGVHHVFLQGYYMDSIFPLYERFKKYLSEKVIIRLHGTDREGIEKKSGKDWNKIVVPRDNELQQLTSLIKDASERNLEISLYVNNHFEGSAPRTIERIRENLTSSLFDQ